ncbi:MAG: XRE family transcriptional regulator [Coriobacteriia bacterium]
MPSRFDEMEARLESSRNSTAYVMEMAIEAAVDEVHTRLDRMGWSDADLARALGVSRPRVHAMLRGEQRNLTVKSLAALAAAMGTGLSINFPPRGFVTMPIYKASAFRERPTQSRERLRVTIGSTTVEGPGVSVAGAELSKALAAGAAA